MVSQPLTIRNRPRLRKTTNQSFKMASCHRFAEISDEFLENLIDNSIPKKTKTATKYGVNIFNGKKRDIITYIFIQIFKYSFTYRKKFSQNDPKHWKVLQGKLCF